MRYIYSIILIGLLSSCSSQNEPNSDVKTNLGDIEQEVSDIESSAVQVVLDFYGGECMMHKGFHTVDNQTDDYFTLEIRKSDLIQTYSNIPQLPASNIALLFYSNLGSEQNKYIIIKVNIVLENGELHEYSFKTKDLEEVEQFIPIFDKTGQCLISKNYTELLSMYVPEVSNKLTTEDIQSYCLKYDSAYGEISTVQLNGFEFRTLDENGQKLVHLIGVSVREKENLPFSLYVDRNSLELVILELNIKK